MPVVSSMRDSDKVCQVSRCSSICLSNEPHSKWKPNQQGMFVKCHVVALFVCETNLTQNENRINVFVKCQVVALFVCQMNLTQNETESTRHVCQVSSCSSVCLSNESHSKNMTTFSMSIIDLCSAESWSISSAFSVRSLTRTVHLHKFLWHKLLISAVVSKQYTNVTEDELSLHNGIGHAYA